MKPCPFCGAEAILSEFHVSPMHYWRVECGREECSANGPERRTGCGASEAWNARPEAVTDETGWLIEEGAGGVIHWIALVENIWKYGWYVSERDQPSPVRRVKDTNEALRFARKEDAEAFISLFSRFLLCPVATEHCWPNTDAALSKVSPLIVGPK